jgi:uncharacterized protein YrrD/gas vesicle protein
MTTQSEAIRQSDLLNQLVLNRNTLEELGRIEVLWMYPQAHRVLGFICKAGFLSGKKLAFKLSQVDALGDNGILTHSQPEETDAEHVRQLESLVQSEVWSDSGRKIGKITDYLFDLKTGAIAHYLLTSDGLVSIASDIYQLAPSQILSLGHKRILISEAIVGTLPVYREGIPHKLTKTGEHLKQDATQELRSLTEQAKGRFQLLTGRARERAQALSQQAKEKLQTLNEQVKEQTQTWLEETKERSEVLAEQVVDRTQNLSKQVEEGIQTLTVQAEEIFDPAEKSFQPPTPPPERSIIDEFDEIFGIEEVAAPNPAAPSDPEAIATPPANFPPPSSPPPPVPPSSSPPPSVPLSPADDPFEFDEWDDPAPVPPVQPGEAIEENDDEPWI